MKYCKTKSNTLPDIAQQNDITDGQNLGAEIQKANIEYIKEINEINEKHTNEVDRLLSKHNTDISSAMFDHVRKMRSIIGKYIPLSKVENEGAEERMIIQNFLDSW